MQQIIQKMSVTKAAILAIASIAALFAIMSITAGTAHAAVGFGNVQVTESVVGGTASPSDFTVSVSGGANVGTLTGSGNVITFSQLIPGTYTLSEVNSPAGYHVTWGGSCDAQGNVTVVSNATAACTATNTFGVVGSIKVTQVIVGGTANTSDLTVHIVKNGAVDTGSPSGSGDTVTFGSLAPGGYTVIESGVPAGYTTVWSGACNAQGGVTVVGNAVASCTITNTFTRTTGGGGGTTGGRGSGRTDDRPTPPAPPTPPARPTR